MFVSTIYDYICIPRYTCRIKIEIISNYALPLACSMSYGIVEWCDIIAINTFWIYFNVWISVANYIRLWIMPLNCKGSFILECFRIVNVYVKDKTNTRYFMGNKDRGRFYVFLLLFLRVCLGITLTLENHTIIKVKG